MKSEIVGFSAEEQKERTYPWLGIATKGKNLIVMFIAFNEGFVVNVGDNNNYRLGYYTDTWYVEDFTEFKGQVVLNND